MLCFVLHLSLKKYTYFLTNRTCLVERNVPLTEYDNKYPSLLEIDRFSDTLKINWPINAMARDALNNATYAWKEHFLSALPNSLK